jgi:hypothetical protein
MANSRLYEDLKNKTRHRELLVAPMRTTTTLAATFVSTARREIGRQVVVPGAALIYLSGLIAARSASFTRAGIGSLRDVQTLGVATARFWSIASSVMSMDRAKRQGRPASRSRHGSLGLVSAGALARG